MGTDSTNNIWASSSTATINYGTEYATITETTSGTTGVLVTDTSHYIKPNDVFEFDFFQKDGTRNYAFLYIRNKANNSSPTNISLSRINKETNTWIHLKCQIVDDVLNVYVDGSSTPIERSMGSTDTDYRLYLNTPEDITELRYKNLKVYPI